MRQWEAQPYYERPYNPTLPQGRTRYLAPASSSGQEIRSQASHELPSKNDPVTGHTPRQKSTPATTNCEAGNTASANPGAASYRNALLKQYAYEASCLKLECVVRKLLIAKKRLPVDLLQGNWTLYSSAYLTAARHLWLQERTNANNMGKLRLEQLDSCADYYRIKGVINIPGERPLEWLPSRVPYVASGEEEKQEHMAVDIVTQFRNPFFVTFFSHGLLKIRFESMVFWAVQESAEKRLRPSLYDSYTSVGLLD